MSKGSKILKLIISILICQGAGAIGSLFTSPAISTWYAIIQKPSFNPPNWIFAPVWILLFLLMGLSRSAYIKYSLVNPLFCSAISTLRLHRDNYSLVYDTFDDYQLL